ncbi:hypothetical protein PHMEG_00012886 [Phytophthora megakarya]|uniref:Uncharacterized protein n=1 Tax=Phytophthora megakarya TaxID=4795 RepID=A0A225W8M2_9STRA|nr:hypothetical protein PHMEG_00012886 [Phytophthora megakarya]
MNLTPGLSSHLFRRGAAQNANRDCKISTPWILDRGGWSAVSKAFNYIVGTTQEDQTVAKSLAGWDLNASSRLPTFENFDHLRLHRIHLLQANLFSAATGFMDRLRLRDDVVDVLTGTAILHYPDMLHLFAATEAEVSAWAIVIHRTLQQPKKETPSSPAPRRTGDDSLLKRQSWLLEQPAQLLVGLAAEHLERTPEATTAQPGSATAGSISAGIAFDAVKGSTSRVHSRAKSLTTVWYEWFLPPLPSARPNRRRYHEYKVAVAFMRIFLPAGYDVTGAESEAKGHILISGREAEANVVAFLEAEHVKAKSHGTIVKVLKGMYAEGKLNNSIRNYLHLRQEGRALEDAPNV